MISMKRILFFACALLMAVVAQAQWNFSTDKQYVLKHVSSGKYLLLHDSYDETNVVNATTLQADGSLFTIAESGNGYVFTKHGTDKTLGLSTKYGWNTSNTGSTAWTLADAENGEGAASQIRSGRNQPREHGAGSVCLSGSAGLSAGR